MAFSGYLIKLGGSAGTPLPLSYIRYESYKVTDNQRMDLDSGRDSTGVLHRTVLNHTASKIEFNVKSMNNTEQASFMTAIRNAWSDSKQRKIVLQYFSPEINDYKTGTFYMPDIQWTIRHIDPTTNRIDYAETKVTFIEY